MSDVVERRLASQVFLQIDFGALGKVIIVLPENNGGDDQFDADFDEALSFVRAVMARRKAARATLTQDQPS